MDRALSKYQHVETPRVWIDDALAPRGALSLRGGIVGRRLAPNLTTALGFPDAPQAYARLVGELARGDAHVAPLGELVTWRRARRPFAAAGERREARERSTRGSLRTSDFTIRDGDGRIDHSRSAE
jgi:hypothetical protein